MSCCTSLHGFCRLLPVFVSALFLAAGPIQGQMTGITTEAIADHDTTGIAALAGHTTYRFYAHFTNPTDKVSAVYGDASAPLTLASSDGFYNAMFGGDFARDVNPALFSFFFETAYDSWFTIGFAPGDSPMSNLTAVGLSAQLTSFNTTGQIDLGDAIGGSYFTTDDPHATAGDDLRVLLGQLTTTGTFTGVFNVQVFVEGSSSNEQLVEAAVFTNAEGVVPGCMDEAAENYNPDAVVGDGSCVYPCALALSAAPSAATCPGGSDGSVQLSVSGQQLEVLFGLDGAAPSQLLAAFNGLSAGQHTVVAVDGIGCSDTASFWIDSPAPFAVEAASVAAVCGGPGGALTLVATGGTAPYTYTVNGVTNAHGAFALVEAGTQPVLIADAAGCSATLEVEVVGTSEATAAVISSPSCTDADGGSVALDLNGNPPLAVEWLSLPGSAPEVDAAGVATGLTEGTYAAVLSANGCADTVAWTLALDVNVDAFSAAVSDATCAGAADGVVTFEGPDADWNIAWEGASQTWSPTGITSLSAGTYAFTVSRSAECAFDAVVTVSEPAPLQWSVSTSNPLCEGDATGAIEAELSGGTAPWVWSVNGGEAASFGGSASLSNLNPGTYALAATDANGCTVEQVSVISWPLPLPAPEALVVAPTSYANGSAMALVDPSFDVAWTTAAGDALGTGYSLEGLAAGTVNLTITNASGCSRSAAVTIPFAGCGAIGASDWPENPEGWYPEGASTVLRNAPLSAEWVLQLPESVVPPTADVTLPVTAFLPQSVTGLPEGVEATADFSQAVPVDGAWCMALSGEPAAVGTYAVTVTGTFYIEFFGSVFAAPGFSFVKPLVVVEAEAVPAVVGCTYVWASNYNPNATEDDGSCAIVGCLEPGACNYQPLAGLAAACDYSCYGCTYSEAENFDPAASADDGSCTFPPATDSGTCMWDGDGNNYINSNDLLLFLGQYDTPCD